jgi:hypothetical protein
VLHQKGAGSSSVSADTEDNIEQAFTRSRTKSIRRAILELAIPRATVHRVVHMNLKLYVYKVQMVHEIKLNVRPLREQFAVDLHERIGQDLYFGRNVVFSDEVTFHLCGKVNRHSCRIRGYENPHSFLKYERDSPKINIWCALSYNRVIGQFCSMKKL